MNQARWTKQAVMMAAGGVLGVAWWWLPPPAQSLTPTDLGRAVYVTHCAGCHGSDGGGNGPAASGMTPAPTSFKAATPATLSDNSIQQAVLVGKPPMMRGYATILTPTELNAVVLYLRTFSIGQ
jgi:mono/diheme cytochrome c family protein